MEIHAEEPASYDSLPPELIKKILDKSWPFGSGVNKATQNVYDELKQKKRDEEYLRTRKSTEVNDDMDIQSTVRMGTEGSRRCREYAAALRAVHSEPPVPVSSKPT
eukprot:jgi/Mesvir1/23382/Mv21077-RA.1